MVEKEKQYTIDILASLAERTIKRLWIIIIILIALLGCMTYLYIDAITQYETISVEQEVDTEQGDAYVAGVGDVYYGANPTESDDPQTQDWR
jgi:uncharacterized protein YpmB